MTADALPPMSAERSRWEDRYAAMADQPPGEPCQLLARCLAPDPPAHSLAARFQERFQGGGAQPRALELACGSGRNALALARAGLGVTAVDCAQGAIDIASRHAGDAGLAIQWRRLDLGPGWPGELAGPWDLILVVNYINWPLFAALPQQLAAGGWLLVQQHLRSRAGNLTGPQNPDHRVAHNALRQTFAPLALLAYREQLLPAAAGRRQAIAQLAAERRHG